MLSMRASRHAATIATTSPSLALRDRAIGLLASYSPDDLAIWQQFFHDRLAETTSAGRLSDVWSWLYANQDVGELPAVAQKLHVVPLSAHLAQSIVCEAHAIASAADWAAFQQAAQPWNTLPTAAQAALGDPNTGCRLTVRAAPSKVRREGISTAY